MYIYIKIVMAALFLFCFSSVYAEDEAIMMGDYFYKQDNYKEAVTEYKRFINFSNSDAAIGDAFYRIGLAERKMGLWEQSIESLNTAVSKTQVERLQAERTISIASTLIAIHKYSEAELQLLEISTFSTDKKLKKDASILRFICNLNKYDWVEANNSMNEFIILENKPILSDECESFFEQIKSIKLKSQNKSVFLSSIIPGSGQIYASDWENGIKALLLNVAWGYLTVRLIQNNDRKDGFIPFIFLINYYCGNRLQAKNSIIKYNNKINQYYLKKGLELVKSINRESL